MLDQITVHVLLLQCLKSLGEVTFHSHIKYIDSFSDRHQNEVGNWVKISWSYQVYMQSRNNSFCSFIEENEYLVNETRLYLYHSSKHFLGVEQPLQITFFVRLQVHPPFLRCEAGNVRLSKVYIVFVCTWSKMIFFKRFQCKRFACVVSFFRPFPSKQMVMRKPGLAALVVWWSVKGAWGGRHVYQ